MRAYVNRTDAHMLTFGQGQWCFHPSFTRSFAFSFSFFTNFQPFFVQTLFVFVRVGIFVHRLI